MSSILDGHAHLPKGPKSEHQEWTRFLLLQHLSRIQRVTKSLCSTSLTGLECPTFHFSSSHRCFPPAQIPWYLWTPVLSTSLPSAQFFLQLLEKGFCNWTLVWWLLHLKSFLGIYLKHKTHSLAQCFSILPTFVSWSSTHTHRVILFNIPYISSYVKYSDIFILFCSTMLSLHFPLKCCLWPSQSEVLNIGSKDTFMGAVNIILKS